MTRTEIINEGIARAGRAGQSINLTYEFDELLRFITREVPCWVPLPREGTIAEDEDSFKMPSNYRGHDYLIMDVDTDGSPVKMGWRDPYKFLTYVKSISSSETSRPRIYTAQKNYRKILVYPPADQSYDYEFSYSAVHPKSSITLTFTSGGKTSGTVRQVIEGATITGETSGATGVVTGVVKTDGTWYGADAVGTFLLSSSGGTFGSETVKVGTTLDLATVSGPVTAIGSFVHFLGDEFDDLICTGIAWKCSEKISDLRDRAPYWKNEFIMQFNSVTENYSRTNIVVKSNAWNPAWNRRVKR